MFRALIIGMFFLPSGAEAFKRDIPNATVRFFDTGHFALELTLRRSQWPSSSFLHKPSASHPSMHLQFMPLTAMIDDPYLETDNGF